LRVPHRDTRVVVVTRWRVRVARDRTTVPAGREADAVVAVEREVTCLHHDAAVATRLDLGRRARQPVAQLQLTVPAALPSLVEVQQDVEVAAPLRVDRVLVEVDVHVEEAVGATLVQPAAMERRIDEDVGIAGEDAQEPSEAVRAVLRVELLARRAELLKA